MKVVETYEDWNALIEWMKNSECYVARDWNEFRSNKKWNKCGRIGVVFFEEKATKIEVTFKNIGEFDRAETRVFYLDGEPRYEESVVPAAAREFGLQYKYREYTTKQIDYIGSASPVLGYNEKWSGTRQKAWEYDLKSAYSWALLQDLPNTDVELGEGIVEEGQIGFTHYMRDAGISSNAYVLVMCDIGERAMWRFPSMTSPYKKYVDKYYKLKESTTGRDKAKAKAYLNVVIGNLQNHNPFVRACVVEKANKRIRESIDENTLMWNTDSIISRVERPDLELSDELGGWSLKHVGDFAYIGNTYQWNDEIPGWRGIPKAWFPKGFDLLKDAAPTRHNPFIVNRDMTIKVNEEYEKYCKGEVNE